MEGSSQVTFEPDGEEWREGDEKVQSRQPLTFSQGTSLLFARELARLFKQAAWNERTLPNHAICYRSRCNPSLARITRETIATLVSFLDSF